MDFIEELRWRGMLHDSTPGIEEHMKSGRVIGYIGFDPTAPSMTIGNYVQIMLLSLLQKSGHTPIVLMGGATGRIGDPSGKDQERQLKSYEELDRNLSFQIEQVKKFLEFDGTSNNALMVNNLDFYRDMNVLDFLRTVGKTLTVNYMLSKESVKKRLETGISFTEFSYQLLQAYDFLCLFKQYGCTLQMGGSDQWGNITSGTEFIRRNTEDGKAFAVTTPLLTKSDGSKFGKSTEGNIWLDPNMTSPYKFYQFWINADDADISKFMRYFTFKSEEEVLELERLHADNPNVLKRLLAEELTIRIHSREAYESVMQVSELLFNKKANREFLLNMQTQSWESIADEIPAFELDEDIFREGVAIDELLTEKAGILASKGDVRRSIKSNALAINKLKITDHNKTIGLEDLMADRFLLVENGKKNKFVISIKL